MGIRQKCQNSSMMLQSCRPQRGLYNYCKSKSLFTLVTTNDRKRLQHVASIKRSVIKSATSRHFEYENTSFLQVKVAITSVNMPSQNGRSRWKFFCVPPVLVRVVSTSYVCVCYASICSHFGLGKSLSNGIYCGWFLKLLG